MDHFIKRAEGPHLQKVKILQELPKFSSEILSFLPHLLPKYPILTVFYPSKSVQTWYVVISLLIEYIPSEGPPVMA